MRTTTKLTQELLREIVDYDSKTGIFRWKPRAGRSFGKAVGAKAGCLTKKGYHHIMVCGERHFAHRLAWLYMTGEWPSFQIDHVDGDKQNNAWSNLRKASPSDNKANCPAYRTNPTGLKGAYWYPRLAKWVAKIRRDGHLYHLGYFETKEQAHDAYAQAAKAIYREFARVS